jgi:hypothetical protein
MFDISFSDADTVTNHVINEYERLLFLNPAPEKIVALPKTHAAGAGFSNEVLLNNMEIPIALPLPFVFLLKPTDAHFKMMNEDEIDNAGMKNLVLYDNAGEHFQPGEDTIYRPGTKHMAHSDGIMFLFDPASDARMRNYCNENDPQLQELSDKICNQETLLTEMISRIRKYKGETTQKKSKIPLIICVTKYDMWRSLLSDKIEEEDPWIYDDEEMVYKLDYQSLLNVSFHVREILRDIAPEIVSTAESFSSQVYFLPSSSFGTLSEQDADKTFLGIRPGSIHPIWITAPLLLFMVMKGYIQWTNKSMINQHDEKAEIKASRIVKDSVIFTIDGLKERMQLPTTYSGTDLYHNKLQKWFTVPGEKQPLTDFKTFDS